mgnify:FL=1
MKLQIFSADTQRRIFEVDIAPEEASEMLCDMTVSYNRNGMRPENAAYVFPPRAVKEAKEKGYWLTGHLAVTADVEAIAAGTQPTNDRRTCGRWDE